MLDDKTINAVRIAVKEGLAKSGCLSSQRLFEYVINVVPMPLDFLDMITIMIKFVAEGWVIAKVNSPNVWYWDWCKYIFHHGIE